MIRARAGALAALTLSTIAPLATAFSPAFSVGLRRSAFSPAASGTLTSPLGLNGKRFTGVSRLSGGSGGALGATAGILDGQKAVDIDGKEVDLGSTYGNVPAVLVVNLASA